MGWEIPATPYPDARALLFANLQESCYLFALLLCQHVLLVLQHLQSVHRQLELNFCAGWIEHAGEKDD